MPPTPKKPTVLIVEPDSQRRRDLSLGLAQMGYETIPALDSKEGARYIVALEPSIAVVPAELLTDPKILAQLGLESEPTTAFVAIGKASLEGQMPQRALFLSADGLTTETLLQRLRSVVLSREIGVDTDVEGSGLVGELAHHPLFELLPRMSKAGVTGTLSLPTGEIAFGEGEVLAASSPPVTGIKAFCRLVRADRGLLRFRWSPEAVPRQLQGLLEDLLAVAFEDSLGESRDPNTQLRLEIGPTFFETQFTPLQRRILAAVRKDTTLQALLDHCTDQLDSEILHEVARLERKGHIKVSAAQTPVSVVTDSTADLPTGAARDLGIHVVPLTVTFGETAYVDGAELSPRSFYELLERREHHPFTTPPPASAFAKTYRDLLPVQDVVSIHISERIPSDTVVHARSAADTVHSLQSRHPSKSTPILEVLDSQQTSVPLGMLVVFAARMATRGLSAPEIRQRIEEISPRLQTLFVVDTLEFLARGGRIGKAQAWFGNLLSIKPILGLREGRIVPVERVRGGRAAQQRLLEIFEASLDPERPVALGVGHARAPAWADRLARSMGERFSVLETLASEMGPVIGTHVGPGTVGAVAFQPREDELPLLAPLES